MYPKWAWSGSHDPYYFHDAMVMLPL